MLSGNFPKFDPSGFEDNYKSCFARSVVVNSQYQSKQNGPKDDNSDMVDTNKGAKPSRVSVCKESYLVDSPRNSVISDSRRSSACSSRIAEMPVENLLLKSQIETLEWQLKQTEASKEMYRAVMQQVVKFLERAHHSLQRLGSKLNTTQLTVPRSQSDHYMMSLKEGCLQATSSQSTRSIDSAADYTAFRDFTWRRQKRSQSLPEEVPVEKLSTEAFRLLRTVQSLLSTGAPDLAHVNNDTSEDLEFLEQLAKEFPRQENDSQRLQVLSPDEDVRIATALNRKLSLQRAEKKPFAASSPRAKEDGNDFASDCSSVISCKSFASEKDKRLKFETGKSSSPPVGSTSSAEDESGFSSMNSFQELGIPVRPEEKLTREALLKSMLQEAPEKDPKDLKLWEKPPGVEHKRWSSTPVSQAIEKQPLKVLWV